MLQQQEESNSIVVPRKREQMFEFKMKDGGSILSGRKNFVVVDVGNGDKKFADLYGNEGIMPAVVGTSVQKFDETDLIDEKEVGVFKKDDPRLKSVSVKIDGEVLDVGEMAINNSIYYEQDMTQDKYESASSDTLVKTALALCTRSAASINNLMLTLPMRKRALAPALQQRFEKTSFKISVGYNGRFGAEKTIAIDKVKVILQPFGIYYDLILDDLGVLNEELAKLGIGISDLGCGTNDLVVFKNLAPIGNLFKQSANGMHKAYNLIRDRLNEEMNIDVHIAKIPIIIATGCTVQGVDISEMVNDALFQQAKLVIGETKFKWEDAPEVERYAFGGGGTELLKPYLEKQFSKPMFPVDCRMSVVRGGLKQARRIWKEDLKRV